MQSPKKRLQCRDLLGKTPAFQKYIAIISRGGKPWKTNREKTIINNEIFFFTVLCPL